MCIRDSNHDAEDVVVHSVSAHHGHNQNDGVEQLIGDAGQLEMCIRDSVEAICLEQLSIYLDDLKNQEVAQRIVEKAVKAAKVREAARKARDVARQKNQLEAAPLVGKLSSCTGRNWKENELFIVCLLYTSSR